MDYAEEYRRLHEVSSGKWFPGSTIKRYVSDIAQLIQETRPRNILDYGSGKGYQYLVLRLHEKWGGLLPHCYDIGVRQLAQKPLMRFDGVICTDMLEHIEVSDIPSILDDIFSFLKPEAVADNRPRFAFFSVACRRDSKAGKDLKKKPAEESTKAAKLLTDGRDLHVTVKPPDWWVPLLQHAAVQSLVPLLTVKSAFELPDGTLVRRDIQ